MGSSIHHKLWESRQHQQCCVISGEPGSGDRLCWKLCRGQEMTGAEIAGCDSRRCL